ncbi:DNA gyrase subunit A [Fistulifera solaris]|uniref:DNA topoisomerase (ATP-hydrolyzing) n=1 Tax=Fistulifera solaris TaxID=1519565 RepID=A0A1Z5KAF6_FISSO|nr:DNA gyrase subunit A [Fistulifera solaris]|eukprot:GAX23176.1 DNA gyrase subunit A [Fistulifera solaris]
MIYPIILILCFRIDRVLGWQGNLLRTQYALGIANTRQPTVLCAATEDGSDDDVLLEGNEEEYIYAPQSDDESFLSESETARQANELAAIGGNHIELQTEISNSFLQYALSIILGRAIPDARDGMKPVHRRILYAMDQLNLRPNTPHRKCARVVGEVLGKFHPHGDVAVYDALVRLAQTFSTNYPLIDGHGNFGSIDADPAAAMRYTEARLTSLSKEAILDELEEDTVDLVPNFDGNELEPNVLPAKLPILLLNGASGIAVGMATNIPPHNLRELMAGCEALIDSRLDGGHPVTDEKLFKLIPAPDFPTGAIIVGTSGAKQLYKTSNGGVVMRATTQMEEIVTKKKGTRTAIIVTQLPYQVNKAALLEKIAALVNEKKLDGIADLRDESDRDGIRVVIELKRDAVPQVVLNNLFKKTALQTTFSGNFLALFGGSNNEKSLVPQRFTLREALDSFIDFRFSTLRRKAAFRLSKVEARANIVNGLLLALKHVDWIIETIQKAQDLDAARKQIEDEIGLNAEQTDAVLKLQLGQLTRLNQEKLESEIRSLESSRQELQELLENDHTVYETMKTEFRELSVKFGRDRQSRILPEEDGEIDEVDLITNSRSVIVVTRGGYIKRMPLKTFESQNRGTRGKRGTSDSGTLESQVSQCFTCNDHDTLLMVTQKGVAYGLRAYQVPIATRTAKGQPIPQVLPIRSDEMITAVLPVSRFSDDEYIVLATEQGWIKKTALSSFEKLTTRGLIIATVEESDSLQWCQPCKDGDDILVGSAMGKAMRFEASKLRPTGRTSRGVKSMTLREGDRIAGFNVLSGGQAKLESEEYVLAVTSMGFGKRINTSEFRAQNRGGQGVIALHFKKGFEQDEMRCLQIVKEEDEILVITSKGVMVRQQVSQIPSQGRSATGVMVQKLDAGDQIVGVSIVPEMGENENEFEDAN